jgi:hypothetical protein
MGTVGKGKLLMLVRDDRFGIKLIIEPPCSPRGLHAALFTKILGAGPGLNFDSEREEDAAEPIVARDESHQPDVDSVLKMFFAPKFDSLQHHDRGSDDPLIAKRRLVEAVVDWRSHARAQIIRTSTPPACASSSPRDSL